VIDYIHVGICLSIAIEEVATLHSVIAYRVTLAVPTSAAVNDM
jgi:hypothetical protein